MAARRRFKLEPPPPPIEVSRANSQRKEEAGGKIRPDGAGSAPTSPAPAAPAAVWRRPKWDARRVRSRLRRRRRLFACLLARVLITSVGGGASAGQAARSVRRRRSLGRRAASDKNDDRSSFSLFLREPSRTQGDSFGAAASQCPISTTGLFHPRGRPTRASSQHKGRSRSSDCIPNRSFQSVGRSVCRPANNDAGPN